MAAVGLATLGILGVGGLGVSATENNSYRQGQHHKHETEIKNRLSEALQKKVDDGTITADQKTAIEDKLASNYKAREAERQANKGSNNKPDKKEMKSKMEADRKEMETWLKEQGIKLDLKDVLPSRDRGAPHMSKGGE